MTVDIDIGREATRIIGQYGREAASFAARCAIELAGEGDDKGALAWCQIHNVIVLLQAERTPGEWLN